MVVMTINLMESNLWNNIYSIVDFVGIMLGIFVSITAIMVFIRTYITRNMQLLSWTSSFGIVEGHQFRVILQSKCLRTLSIKKVVLVIGDEEIVLKEIFSVRNDENDEPIIVKPFQTVDILSKGATYPLFESDLLSNCKNIAVKITFFDGKTKKCKYKIHKKKSNKATINQKRPHSEYLEGVLITNMLRYVVKEINKDGNEKVYAIYNFGYIPDSFYEVKRIPMDAMKNVEALEMFLKENSKNKWADYKVFKAKHSQIKTVSKEGHKYGN